MNTHRTPLRCGVAGIGVWSRKFANAAQFAGLLNGEEFDEAPANGPKPEVIPANERRRAPLPVRMAVETSWQALQQSTLSPQEVSCVFCSGFGDVDITDYMCRTLNTEAKQLSPTKFHNSVHNAPAGYWTISTGCMQSANSVAGFDLSVPVTLLEGMTQCVLHRKPVLLTFCDPPVISILQPILINQLPFSASILLIPDSESANSNIEISVEQRVADWPAVNHPSLNELYTTNPCARVLGLLELLAGEAGLSHFDIPLSSGTSLSCKVGQVHVAGG